MALTKATFSMINGAPVNVLDYGAVGDGVTDDTVAIQAAHATGQPVYYPYGIYKYVGYFPECEGGIIGEGWSASDLSSGSDQASRIIFYNCTDPTKGAIKIKNSGDRSFSFRIENISIEASSWDATTGCLGYGIDVKNTVIMSNVNINGFRKSNLYIANGTPFGSRFESVRSVLSGEHGAYLGLDANDLSFINYQGKWNGAPTFGNIPTTTGNYDGFYTYVSAPDAPPESLSIIGGDCSYNSRYGWNFQSLRYSALMPGYAEFNFANYSASPETRYEAAIGDDVYFVNIMFQEIRKPASGFPFHNQQTSVDYWITNRVFLGGKQIHPPRDFDAISNYNAYDLTDGWYGTYQDAPRKTTYLSRSDDFSDNVQFVSNKDPAGNDTDKATEAALSLVGGGTWAVGLGAPSRFIKLSSNVVRLPDVFYQATTTGWAAGSVARGIGTAEPTTGTWARGDIVFNLEPSAGGFAGWICVTAGTPGTWKTFGAISA
jgi:hypothetical protein